MNYDTLPMPSTHASTSRYMESKVKEDLKILNVITENYAYGCITEDAALALIDIVRKDESEYANAITESDGFELFSIPYSSKIPYVGERVLPFSDISKDPEESIYKPYGYERGWGTGDAVTEAASTVACEKETELKKFLESGGKEGFDEYTRNMYGSYADDRLPRDIAFEACIETKVLSGILHPEDASIALGLVHHMFDEAASVGEMRPVTEPNQPAMPKNADAKAPENPPKEDTPEEKKEKFKKDLSYFGDGKSSDKEEPSMATTEGVVNYTTMFLRQNDFFLTLENESKQSNPALDQTVRKLYRSLQGCIVPPVGKGGEMGFKHGLNAKKDAYVYKLKNESDLSKVESIIKKDGFKHNKDSDTYNKKSGKFQIIITVDNKRIEVKVLEGDEVVQEKMINGADIDTNPKPTLEEEVRKCTTHKDIAVRDSAKKALKVMMTSSDQGEIKKAVNSFRKIWNTYNQVQIHKVFKVKESEDAESNLFGDILVNYDAERNSILERDGFISVANKMALEKYLPVIAESEKLYEEAEEIEAGKIVKALTESPNPLVYKYGHNTLMNLFYEGYENPDSDDIHYASYSTEKYAQDKDEGVCETVLNQSEFNRLADPEYYMESDKDIDEDIKPIVELLNRLGYTVKYSCSGHYRSHKKEDTYKDGVYHGKLYTTARIVFDKKYPFKSFPDGWYSNKNADVTAIYVRPYTYNVDDGTPDESFKKWKDRYMRALKNWAEEIGSADETDDDAKAQKITESFMESLFAPENEDEDNQEDTTPVYERDEVFSHLLNTEIERMTRSY